MKKREFAAVLRSITTQTKAPPGGLKRKKLDRSKAQALPPDIKKRVVNYLVRNRDAVLVEFIDQHTDISWLASCGYMYRHEANGYSFVGLCDHVIG